MTKTELLNRLATDPDERLVLARIADKMDACRARSTTAFTQILSPAQQSASAALIAQSGAPRHLFWGGFEGAERRICVFLPDWQDETDFIAAENGPLVAVELRYPEGAGLTHRDFLGAILGLGITREKIGDLLVGPVSCQVVLLGEQENTLLTQLFEVGRQHVKVARCGFDLLVPQEKTVTLLRATVATLRLDAVAAAGFSISRAKMTDLILGKKVMLSGRECAKPDRLVVAGDSFVCRGMGKCILKEVAGTSRKGRQMLVLERYV